MASADDNARELCRRADKAFGDKSKLDALHHELALNFYPERADFVGDRELGEEFAMDIYDDEPLRCRRDLADARVSALRPDGQEWNRIQTQDDELNERPDISKALDAVNKRWMRFLKNFRNGFAQAMKEGDGDLVTFGYQVLSAETEIDRNGDRVPIIRCWHPRDCAFYMDITGVKPDVFFRKFKLAARHIRKKFPDAELHENIEEALEKDPDKEFNLCHHVMPYSEYDFYKKPKGQRAKAPWASVYYDADHKSLLREGSSERFHYIVDRWMRIPGSQYGYSPAANIALPGARGMQTMAMVLLEAGEQQLRPPMMGVDGAAKSDISFVPGDLTWYDRQYADQSRAPFEPLLPPNRTFPIGIDLIMRATMAMRDSWYLSKLRLPGQSKTAFETQALVEQFVRENIPLFTPWQSGMEMTLEEVFWVALEVGVFRGVGQMPRELFDQERVFDFKNMLSDAIELNRANQATQIMGLAAGAAQFNPAAAKRLDFEKMLESSARGIRAPANWLVSEEEAAEAAAQEAQTQQFLQAIGTAGQVAEVAKTGAEAAATLTDIGSAPAADESYVYGPA